MKDRIFGYIALFALILVGYSYTANEKEYTVEELRTLYASGDSKLWPKPFLDDEVKANFEDIGPLPEVVFPEDNPYSEEKYNLGKALFFESQLSKSGKISCATCHKPDKAWADRTMVNFGHDDAEGLRNVPTILNAAYAKKMFWDGRVKTLEEQVKHPIENSIEMNLHSSLALANIKNDTKYKEAFKKAFGTEDFTEDHMFKAIATFERTLVSTPSRFDLFISGKKDEFSISDQNFYNIGVSFFSGGDDDLGLYEITKNPADKKKFRTPTLREISETKPYMHNGQFPELRNVVMMYNFGMGKENLTPAQKKDPLYPKKSHLIQRLDLSDQEVTDLVAFLRTLKSSASQPVNN